MGYKAGKDLLIKVNFGQGAGFQTVGGIQTRRARFSDTAIDVTNQESEGNWTEMLAGVGKKSITISGDGVFNAGPTSTQLMQAWLGQVAQGFTWQVIFPGLGTLEGPFTIGTLEFSGDQSTEMKFSIELTSAGPVGFTPNTAA